MSRKSYVMILLIVSAISTFSLARCGSASSSGGNVTVKLKTV